MRRTIPIPALMPPRQKDILPMPLVARILDHLPRDDHHHASSIRVLAWTGLRVAELERLDREHVNFVSGTLYRPRTLRAPEARYLAPGVWVPLRPEAHAALLDFDHGDFWRQPLARARLRTVWRVALTRTHDEGAAHVSPVLPLYALRLSFIKDAIDTAETASRQARKAARRV